MKKCRYLSLVLLLVLLVTMAFPVAANAAVNRKVDAEARIAASVGRTNFIAGPYTCVAVQVRNNTKKPLNFIGSSPLALTAYNWAIMKNSTKEIVLSGKAYLSNEAGEILYQATVPKKASAVVYYAITIVEPMFFNGQMMTADRVAAYINDTANYTTGIFPYFATKKLKKGNPLKTKPKYMISALSSPNFNAEIGFAASENTRVK